MEGREIIAQARVWADDTVEPYLYPDPDLLRYLNEAQNEAAVRVRHLVDSTTDAVTLIQLVEGQASYPLHASVIVARRVDYIPALAGARRRTLDRLTFDLLDRRDPDWRTLTGSPCSCVQDLDERRITLDRIPTAATLGTLRLTVWRRPLESQRLNHPRQVPVTPEDDHLPLAHWICHRMFTSKDGETGDEKLSLFHLAEFERRFGPRPTAAQLRMLATDHAGETESYFY